MHVTLGPATIGYVSPQVVNGEIVGITVRADYAITVDDNEAATHSQWFDEIWEELNPGQRAQLQLVFDAISSIING